MTTDLFTTSNDDISAHLRLDSIKPLLPFIQRIDPDKSFEMYLPSTLLVDVERLKEIFDDGELVYGGRKRKFKGVFKSGIVHQAFLKYWQLYKNGTCTGF